MAATLPTEGIDFPYLLLEYYKKLGLSEKEVAVLFMINHLNNQKNDVVRQMGSSRTSFPGNSWNSSPTNPNLQALGGRPSNP